MYLDKLLRNHTLMQTIARTKRIYESYPERSGGVYADAG